MESSSNHHLKEIGKGARHVHRLHEDVELVLEEALPVERHHLGQVGLHGLKTKMVETGLLFLVKGKVQEFGGQIKIILLKNQIV